MIDCTLIVVSYRSAADLPALIDSIPDAADGLDWRLIVVDNAAERELRALAASDHRVEIVDAGGNRGYSGGLNVGMAHMSASRWVVFLNPDLRLMAGSLRRLTTPASADVYATVPTIVDESGRRQNSLRHEPTVLSGVGEALFGDTWPGRPRILSETERRPDAYEHPREIEWATGAALAVRSDVVGAIGPWDAERFFLYSEETDYARRIRAHGGRIMFEPTAVVSHRAGGSGSSPQLDALLEVNKLRYFQKWHGSVASAAFAVTLLARNLARPHRPGARAAVRALLSRRSRASLPGGPR